MEWQADSVEHPERRGVPRIELVLELQSVRASWRRILAGTSSWPGPIDFDQLWLERLLGAYSMTTSSAAAPRTPGLIA